MRALAPSDRDALAVAPPRLRGRLFLKYVALFVAVVCLALLANGLFEVWFSYQEHRTSLVRIQRTPMLLIREPDLEQAVG